VKILKRFSDALRNLFRPPATAQPVGPGDGPAKPPPPPAPATDLEQKVLRLVDNMPTMPDTATKAMALLDDRDVQFADLARLIERDAAIATGLLRVANSVLYASSAPAVKLDQAVVRLGTFQCKNLMMAIGLRSVFRGMAGPVKAQCQALWHHGFVTASLCVQINRAYRLGFSGEEFSAGLLHDLGRILLALADPDCLNRAGAMDFHEAGDVLGRERAAIGIDHCGLGGWFGEMSNLPESLVHAIRCHHEPQQTANSPHHRLVALAATADHMANHVQRNEDAAAYDSAGNAGLHCLAERWTPTKREQLLAEVPVLMAEAERAAARENAGD
jgi:HD-like signal output (HDOD) protein